MDRSAWSSPHRSKPSQPTTVILVQGSRVQIADRSGGKTAASRVTGQEEAAALARSPSQIVDEDLAALAPALQDEQLQPQLTERDAAAVGSAERYDPAVADRL